MNTEKEILTCKYLGEEYRTNKEGEGLWIWDGEWCQIKGTGDFYAYNNKNLYNKLYYIAKKDD